MRTLPAAALVTGATSGIGEAFARALPRSTALLLTGRDEAALARLAAELGESGRIVETRAADLATDAGLDAVCAAAESATGNGMEAAPPPPAPTRPGGIEQALVQATATT